MALNTKISNAAAIASCNSTVDLIDGGATAGILIIYDGTQPVDVDTVVTTQVILAELLLSDPAFGAAVDGIGKVTATANAISDDVSANNTGTATWFRVYDSNGVAIIDGSVGIADADLILNSVNVIIHGLISIISWTFSISKS